MKSLLPYAATFTLWSFAALAADDNPLGRLPRTVTPDRYVAELRVDPRDEGLAGDVRIDVTVHEATETFWMHGRDLDLDSAIWETAEGERIPMRVTVADANAGVLKLTLPTRVPAGKARMSFRYTADYGKQLSGAYKVQRNGDAYVLTQMEPMAARTAFPSFDEPAFKTPWELSLTVPEGYGAFANTAQVSREAAGEGFERVRFAPTAKLPSYLLAFAVGPYDVVNAADIPPNALRERAVPLRGIAPKGSGPALAYALEQTPKVIEALETYFGMPYPFEKLDLLAAPGYGGGAMENPGLVVYRENFLLGIEAAPTGLRRQFWNLHAHELAHQWFGNLVTMTWWDDLWLNEGFASWMASKLVDRLHPGFFESRTRLEATHYAITQDSLATARRVREPVHDFVSVVAAFDGITYQKGAAILAMFEYFLGEEGFRDGIRQYLREHAGSSATSADLMLSLAAHAPSSARLQAAFASFTDQAGVPFLRTQLSCGGGKPRLRIEQSRYLPVGSKADPKAAWIVPACFRLGTDGEPRRQCELLEDRISVVELDSEECPRWVHPNADGAGYYRFVMAGVDQAALATHFVELGELEQQSFADSLVASFRNGAMSLQSFLDAARPLAASTVRSVAMAPKGTFDWLLVGVLETPEQRALLRSWIIRHYREQLDAIGTAFKPGEPEDARLLRQDLMLLLAETAFDPGMRELLAGDGKKALDSPKEGMLAPDAVHIDVRGGALRMAVAEGGEAEFESALRHLTPATEAQLRSQLVAALGNAKQPALRRRALELMLDERVRPEEVPYLIIPQLRNPDTRPTARAWLRENYEAVSKRMPDGWQAFMPSLEGTGLCSTPDARGFADRYSTRVANVEGGPIALRQAIEDIELCAAMRASMDSPKRLNATP